MTESEREMRDRIKMLAGTGKQRVVRTPPTAKDGDALVRLAENLAVTNNQADRDALTSAYIRKNGAPVYGSAVDEAEALGGKVLWDAYNAILRRENLDGSRKGDQRYAKLLALREHGVTVANAPTLSAALLLAEADEPIKLNESRETRVSRASKRVASERKDLVGGSYGTPKRRRNDAVTFGDAGYNLGPATGYGKMSPQTTPTLPPPAPMVVTPVLPDPKEAALQKAIGDVVAQLAANPPPDEYTRAKLRKQLEELCPPGVYGFGAPTPDRWNPPADDSTYGDNEDDSEVE
jgi:hypothetical protein